MTKIIFFGDNDTTSDAVKVLDAIKKEQNVDQYVFLGDGPYSKTGTKWVGMMKPFFPDTSKLIIVQGNHDDEESESEKTQQDIEAWIPSLKDSPAPQGGDQSWENPTWLHSKQIGDIYLIGMNSQDMDVEFKRNQYNWVLKQLATAVSLRQQGKINWLLNAVHKPWFTLKSSHSPYTKVREIYSAPFQKAGVDQNWHGHNHNDQCWFDMVAINQEGNSAGKNVTVLAADGKTLDHSKPDWGGWTTNINGHSGHEHNKFKENATANKNVMWANDSVFSYAVVESNPQTKILNTKWKGVDGKVLFEYNITRAGVSTTPPQQPGGGEQPTSPPPGPGYRWDSAQKKWLPKLEDPNFVPNSNNTGGQTQPPPTTPPPPPTTGGGEGNLIWTSKGIWDNGQKRVVNEGEGNQGPDGKGLHTAASGDPSLTIDGDGIAHLESSKWGRIYIYTKQYNVRLEGFFRFETDHGEDDNISIKMRSRHGNNNHPQGGNNNFGGVGFAFHPSGQCSIKAEITHGGDSFQFGKLQGPKLGLNEWHKYTIDVFDENNGITASVKVDDKDIGTKKWSNPDKSAIDKAAFAEDSYFWIRMNCHDGKRAKCGIKDLKLYNLGG